MACVTTGPGTHHRLTGRWPRWGGAGPVLSSVLGAGMWPSPELRSPDPVHGEAGNSLRPRSPGKVPKVLSLR